MTFLDNGTMNGNLILWWILQLSDGSERHFGQYFSTNLHSIRNQTMATNHERC